MASSLPLTFEKNIGSVEGCNNIENNLLIFLRSTDFNNGLILTAGVFDGIGDQVLPSLTDGTAIGIWCRQTSILLITLKSSLSVNGFCRWSFMPDTRLF